MNYSAAGYCCSAVQYSQSNVRCLHCLRQSIAGNRIPFQAQQQLVKLIPVHDRLINLQQFLNTTIAPQSRSQAFLLRFVGVAVTATADLWANVYPND